MSRAVDLTQLQYPSPGTLYFKHKHYVFEYRGNGLEYQDYQYVADIEPFLPPMEPKRTKTGAIAARQPQVPTKSKNWWEAQCVFRGMSKGGATGDIQNRLRQNKTASMLYELEQAEKRLAEEWQQKEDNAKGQAWSTLTTNEAKAAFDAGRLLREHFRDQSERILVLKMSKSAPVHKAAASQGLDVRDTNVPSGSEPKGERGEKIDRWIVIGRSEFEVCKKIADIHAPGKGSKSPAQKHHPPVAEEQNQNRQSAVTPISAPRQAPRPKEVESSDIELFDVMGQWTIDCPYMQEQWGKPDEKCLMYIKVNPVRQGGRGGDMVQMWANFNFISITGVMRFLCPTGNKGKGKGVKAGSKRKKEEFNDDEDDDDDGGHDVVPARSFIMSRSQLPSAANPTWEYRWRGEETGEGEIQLYADELQDCRVTFRGPRGQELVGTFNADFTGQIGFTGRRLNTAMRGGGGHGAGGSRRPGGGGGAGYGAGITSAPAGCVLRSHGPSGGVTVPSATVETEWNDRSDDAYEYSKTSRWC